MFNTDFNALKLSLANPEEIKKWSFGEVLKPETINYRTLKPEKDGLFDERIFGPTKDFECYCGKYKRVRFKGVVCDKCGVEVTESRVRRERMAHIELAMPVVHTWYFKRSPSKLALLLDIAPKELEGIIYYSSYLVLEIDEEKRAAILEKQDAILQGKKDELNLELNTRIKQLEGNLSKKIETLKRQAKGEGAELEIEHLKTDGKREVLRLRQETVKDEERMQVSFSEISQKIRGVKFLGILGENDLTELKFWEADAFFKYSSGAKSLLSAIEKIDLVLEIKRTEKELLGKSLINRRKALIRLKILQGFKNSKVDPAWMIIKVLPVIPPDLRPMVQLPGGRFATSDLNDLYRKVINRNNRLKNLLRLGAPEIILVNEERMLQEAVDALIEGVKRPVKRARKELKSLTESLSGKQGRFRQNLLGKRVDYSGRSVIVVGPELRLDQVGLPKEMALELFKPYVLRELILNGLTPNLKSAKNILEAKGDEVWDILEKVVTGRPVLLNRAPTLHRQNIQAFYPVLIEGSAIRLHPAVCVGFNADFDGDAMSVHVVLGEKAIEEAINLMLSPRNLLKLSDGKPIIDMKNELCVGLYFLTTLDEKAKSAHRSFLSFNEAITCYQQGELDVRAPIEVFEKQKELKTSVGRILLNEILPPDLRFFNEAVSREKMRSLILQCYKNVSVEATVSLIDNLKDLGRMYGTTPGISFSVFDFSVPKEKDGLLKEAETGLEKIESNFKRGLLTDRERYSQIVALWQETTAKIGEIVQEGIDPLSMVGLIVGSKASRANRETLGQMGGMRGLMVDSKGRIKETPIRTAEIEGATPFEGFLAALGGRKGLIDTALLTADAGYLTRRLVDVGHDVLVRETDCKTKEGILIAEDQSVDDWTLRERIVGRVCSQEVSSPHKKDEAIVARNEVITEEKADLLIKAGVKAVKIRSLLTCQTKYGVCSHCYGYDMAKKSLVELGTAVGVIAAQSIGEPGTQLTLRTFHAGGIAKKEITQGLPRVEELLEARIPKEPAILTELSGTVEISEEEDFYKVKVMAEELVEGKKIKEERLYQIPRALELKVKNGDLVGAGDTLTSGNLDLAEISKFKGLLFAQQYLLKEVQSVYKGQGVTINDKHLEIVLRKMASRVKITKVGDSAFRIGEMIDINRLATENEKLQKNDKTGASGVCILAGITRSSLNTDSWLSAASFIETANVLSAAAIDARPQVDKLLGLKENVIIGRLIPVGERAVLAKE